MDVWQASPQLSCGDACPIWTWYARGNQCFVRVTSALMILSNVWINGNCCSSPHASQPFWWHVLTLNPPWISNHMPNKVWDEITHSFKKLQRWNGWTLGMDKGFLPTLYNEYNYLFLLGLKLIHIDKKDSNAFVVAPKFNTTYQLYAWSLPAYKCMNYDSIFISVSTAHADVIKWKHLQRYWPFVRRIHRLPMNSPHKGQWRGALMCPLMCARTNN